MKKKISTFALAALSLFSLNLYAANESVDHDQPIAQQEEKSAPQEENQVSADCGQAEEGNTTTAESSTDKATESGLPA